jgi:hypothetical protein
VNFNPKAPPVYRPQQAVTASAQLKSGNLTRSAPPVYRPQPQNVSSGLQRKTVSKFALESRPAPPVYRPQQISAPNAQLKPAAHSSPAQRSHPAPPIVTGKSSLNPSQHGGMAVRSRLILGAPVVQRMEYNNNNSGGEKQVPTSDYTSSSVSTGESSVRGEWRSHLGEHLVIKDTGTEFKAYVNGKYVGYISYKEEFEDGQRRLRFGYILVNSSQQGKKISAALIFCFAMNALEKGLYLVVVGHPDPNLKNYWEHMGFDYTAAQQKLHQHYGTLYPLDQIPLLTDVKPTEAAGSADDVLRRAQVSFRTYWN